MPDIVELLSAAARTSDGAPDLAALELRASHLRRRERLVKGAAALVVVLIAVPLARLGAGDKQVLEQVPTVKPTATRVVALPSPAVPTRAPGAAPGSTPLPGATGQPAGPGTAPVPGRTAPAGQPTAAASSPPPTYPAGASCTVSSTTVAPGESRSCTFTATRSGGARLTFTTAAPGVSYRTDAVGVVTVVRNGVRRTYDLYSSQTRCVDAVIVPGDAVTVMVQQSRSGYRSYDLSAGEGFGC